jgi:hypothetical protein
MREGLEDMINKTTEVIADIARDFNDGQGWFGNNTMIGGAVGGFILGFILGLKKA